ncbi:hypothetical protein [Streptomyces sp. NPDC059262]|uniref:hypothetical protein n=1 Tax=Streptomyces sp. NPDC059262 TaxID=3346797 RepID=UPI0036B9C5B6
MRYLPDSFILSALKRGHAVEQFLGPAGSPERPGIYWVEIRPTGGTCEVYLHSALDCEPLTGDLDALPPLIDSEEEDFGLLLVTESDPIAALDAAESSTGSVRGRWVNQSMAGDEYRDYVLAGRPAAAPDGQPWPSPQRPSWSMASRNSGHDHS